MSCVRANNREECESGLLKDLLEPLSTENCLCVLLARMNDHTKAYTGLEVTYNGIKLIRTSDPSAKVVLDNLVPPLAPLSVLHIGTQRPMNLIPKKFSPSLPCVVDLMMEHLSVLTIFPETLENMSIHYPGGNTSTASTEHTFIISTINDGRIEGKDKIMSDDVRAKEEVSIDLPNKTPRPYTHEQVNIKTDSRTAGQEPADSETDDLETDEPEVVEQGIAYSETADLGPHVLIPTNQDTADPKNTLLGTIALETTDHETDAQIYTEPETANLGTYDPDKENAYSETAEKETVDRESTESDPDILPTPHQKTSDSKTADTKTANLGTSDPDQENFDAETAETETADPVVLPTSHQETADTETAIIGNTVLKSVDSETTGLETSDVETAHSETTDPEIADISIGTSDQKSSKPETNELETADQETTDQNTSAHDETATGNVPIDDTAQINESLADELVYKNTINESTGSGSYVAVSLSPDVDSEKLTPEKSRENSTSNPILFLQKGIYTDVVKKLSSKSIKPWLKDCGLKPASTLVTNKKILLGHIEGAIAGDTMLSAQFIGRLTKNMNDSAILTELFNFGINEKEMQEQEKLSCRVI